MFHDTDSDNEDKQDSTNEDPEDEDDYKKTIIKSRG